MMEENKIPEELGGNLTAQAPEETGTATAVADMPVDAASAEQTEPQIVVDVPDLPPQKPKTKLPVALISVIAVLLVVMVGAFASGLIANPERAVRKALTATGESIDKRSEQIANEIPLMQQSMETAEPKPGKTTFSFTFDTLTGDNIPPEAGLIINLLKGIGVQGTYINDPAAMVDEFDGALALNGTDLFGLYAYSSPEHLAIGLPNLIDEAYSINPKTFTADMQNSPLYSLLGLTTADVAEAQELLDAQYSAAESLNDLDYQKMQADVRAIIGKAIENAEFKSAGRKDGMKSYTVTLPGEDVKTVLNELVRYVYLDSPFQSLFRTSMEPTLAYEGMTYDEFINGMILDPLSSLPNLPATLTLGIDKTIKTARVDIVPDGAIGTGIDAIESIEATFAREDNGDVALWMGFNGKLSAQPFKMEMDMIETYADGAYVIDVSGAITSSEFNMDFKETVNCDKAGAVGLSLGFDFDGSGVKGGVGMDFIGTVKADGDKTVYDFPTVGLRFNMDGVGKYDANFVLKSETVPAQTPVAPARESKPVLAMTEAELEEDLIRLDESLNALESTISGVFGMGAAFAMPPAA